MDDRGYLGRELVRIVEDVRNRPPALRRSAALRGLEPARHSTSAQPETPPKRTPPPSRDRP